MRRFLVAATLLLVAVLPTTIAAQNIACDAGDLEVLGVGFAGNRRFRDAELARAIATTPSSWFRRALHVPLGPRRCLDSLELRRDEVRLRLFYRQHGYYKTTVGTNLTSPRPGGVMVQFQIAEGPPVIVDSLAVIGLDSVAPRPRRALLGFFDPFRHGTFDRVRLQAAIDSVVNRLRNIGYAYVQPPLHSFHVDTAANRAVDSLQFFAGPGEATVARIGQIRVQITPDDGDTAISAGTVKRLLAFDSGDVYRQRQLLRSQRDLYTLETYRHVDITAQPHDGLVGDSIVDVLVKVSEGPMNSVRVGAGWATLDCVRAQGRFTNRDFMGNARRLELTARLSKIGLCPNPVRDDPFSQDINYYGAATLRLPALFGPHNVPSLTLFSERASEYRSFERHTPIGAVAEVTRDLKPNDFRGGLPLTLSYRFEYGRTDASDAVFCALFNRCSLSDIAQLQQNSALQVASVGLARVRTDNLLDPSTGSQLHLELRSGVSTADTGGGRRFNRAYGEGSIYRRLTATTVLALRAQLATVVQGLSLSGTTQFVPPEERLYAGGPSSVRGYNQNLLGPIVYIVDTFTVNGTTYETGSRSRVLQYSPTGGNTLVVGNVELRGRSPVFRDVLQLATFVDAGLVWNRPTDHVSLGDLRVTPGLGVRVESPVGPLRVDVAYNPYTRVLGPAFYVDEQGGRLLCVSPGNTFVEGVIGATGECKPTFSPSTSTSFFGKLTFHFSIGQAF